MYRTTMPYADFCCTLKKNRFFSSRVPTTCSRPPVVSSTAFSAPPPDLPALAFDGYGLCCSLPTRPRVLASYPVLVHRRTPLLHASFRPHLAMTPLRFANPSPPSGWIRDSHPQTVEHARHTMTPGRTPGLEIASAIPTSADRRRRRSSNFPARVCWRRKRWHTV